MDTLSIRNWEKWQSYRSDRGQPPWIKLHRRLMRDPDWVALTDAQRGQLVAIWLLAADRDGVIPASPAILQKLCYMDSEPDLQVLVDKGFIKPCRHLAATVTSPRRQRDVPETEAEAEEEVEKKKKKPPTGAKKKHAIPKNWKPTEAHQLIAYRENADVEREAELFKDHAIANARLQADWDRAFNNWLRKASEFQGTPRQQLVNEEARDAERRADMRSRESERSQREHEAEVEEANEQAKAERESYESLPEDEQAEIEADVKRRARMIQPNGKLTKMVLKGCFAQAMAEREDQPHP